MLPPPTRINFASPCFVLTMSMASSRALEISSRADDLSSGGTCSVVAAFSKIKSEAYIIERKFMFSSDSFANPTKKL